MWIVQNKKNTDYVGDLAMSQESKPTSLCVKERRILYTSYEEFREVGAYDASDKTLVFVVIR